MQNQNQNLQKTAIVRMTSADQVQKGELMRALFNFMNSPYSRQCLNAGSCLGVMVLNGKNKCTDMHTEGIHEFYE